MFEMKMRVSRCFSLLFYFSHHKIPTEMKAEFCSFHFLSCVIHAEGDHERKKHGRLGHIKHEEE